MSKKYLLLMSAFVLTGVFGFNNTSFASHSWNEYHFARKANPFMLKLGDNVSSAWDSYLTTASTKWSLSSVLDTITVPGLSNTRTCRATLGRVEVCNRTYGNNNWLGIAQVWITNGTHITQGTVKLNDTHFNTPKYDKSALRNMVMCQEIAHTLGLDHQDEDFYNPNLGTCMDYTNDPARDDGKGDNQYPNIHDYDELVAIYTHLDPTTTISASTPSKHENAKNDNISAEDSLDWGKAIKKDKKGRDSVFEKNLGKDSKILTHVFWIE